MATAATIDVELRANTARYRAAMLDASRSANQHLGHIRQEAKRTADSFDQLKRAAVGVVTFQALKGSIGQLTQAHKEVQALHLGLRGATGSAAVAADSYSWVSQQAKDLGLDLHTAAQGFMRLTASATPNGVAMEKQRELFLGLSRAATVMQLDTQKVDSAVTALSQSFGKGRFQAEELRQQLGEAIPGILPRFQNAVMAMTEGTELAGESFDSLLQKGLLDTQRFLPAMITAFEGMATGWEEASRSMQAEQNRLGNAWRELKLELGDGAFADGATAALRATTVALEGLSSSLPVVVPLMGSLAAVKLGQSAAAWVQRLNESSAASLRQAVAARNTANELVNKTRRALEDARAEQRRAAAIGGSIAADAQAAEAARVHRNALIQLEAANNRVAVASNRAATMAKATLGFFGGPAGLAFMVASTAASWLVFRDNTDAASRALDNMSGSLKEAVEQFKELDRLQQASILSELRGQVADASRDVNTEVTNMVNQVQNRLRYFGAEAAEAGQQFADSIGKLRAQYAAGGITAGEFNDAVQAQIELLTRNERVASALGGQIAQQGGEVAAAAVKHRELSDRLSGMSGAQREAESAVDGTTEAMRRQQAQADATKAAITSYAQRMAEEVKRGKVQLAQLQGGSAAALKQEFGQFVLDAGGPGAFDPKDLKELVSQYRARRKQILEMEAIQKRQRAQSESTSRAEAESRRKEQERLREQREAQERVIEAKLRGMAVDRQIADYQEAEQQRHARTMAGMRRGGNVRIRLSMEDAVSAEFLAMRKDLDRSLQNRLATIPIEEMERRNEEQARYLELIGKTVVAESAAMQTVRQNYQEILAAQADWTIGMQQAMDDYAATAANVSAQTYDLFTNAFKGAEDAFVEFVTTGKASFADFAQAVIADLARIAARQAITGMFGSAMQGLNFSFMQGFATGGYTGPGARLQPAGVVHKGEVVWSQKDVARAGGVAAVEAMRLGLRGYASGGAVGPRVPVSRGGGWHVEINNHAGARVEPREQVQNMPDGTQLRRLIIDVFADDFANGGRSAAVVKNRLGLRDAV